MTRHPPHTKPPRPYQDHDTDYSPDNGQCANGHPLNNHGRCAPLNAGTEEGPPSPKTSGTTSTQDAATSH